MNRRGLVRVLIQLGVAVAVGTALAGGPPAGVMPRVTAEVVCDPDFVEESRSSGRPIAFGYTSTGKYLACIYELLDEVTVYAITAYEPEE